MCGGGSVTKPYWLRRHPAHSIMLANPPICSISVITGNLNSTARNPSFGNKTRHYRESRRLLVGKVNNLHFLYFAKEEKNSLWKWLFRMLFKFQMTTTYVVKLHLKETVSFLQKNKNYIKRCIWQDCYWPKYIF